MSIDSRGRDLNAARTNAGGQNLLPYTLAVGGVRNESPKRLGISLYTVGLEVNRTALLQRKKQIVGVDDMIQVNFVAELGDERRFSRSVWTGENAKAGYGSLTH